MFLSDAIAEPLQITPFRSGVKYDNSAQHNYEKAFAEKIHSLRGIPGYPYLHRWAQRQIERHCGDPLDGISARVYMDRVNEAPQDKLERWAKKCLAKDLWKDYLAQPKNPDTSLRADWIIYTDINSEGQIPKEHRFASGALQEEVFSWFEATFGVAPPLEG